MKTLPLCGLMLALAFGAGCVRRYDVIMINQRVITSHGKPKLDKVNNTFRFKDAEGTVHVISSTSVNEIKPR